MSFLLCVSSFFLQNKTSPNLCIYHRRGSKPCIRGILDTELTAEQITFNKISLRGLLFKEKAKEMHTHPLQRRMTCKGSQLCKPKPKERWKITPKRIESEYETAGKEMYDEDWQKWDRGFDGCFGEHWKNYGEDYSLRLAGAEEKIYVRRIIQRKPGITRSNCVLHVI